MSDEDLRNGFRAALEGGPMEYLRLANAFERTGRLEEAYKTLLDADALFPSNLK